jgi:signal transduction histidine kinase/ActR/RegA family two-component response regulator
MTPERSPSGTHLLETSMADELRQQLDQERRAHHKTIAYAKSLENVLQALRSSTNLQQLLVSLLRVLVDHVGAISGVLWLHEGESLRCASGLGLTVDIGSLGELGLQQIFGKDSKTGPKLESDAVVVPSDHPLCRCLESESEALCVPLRNGEALVAVVCLAWREPQLLERSSHEQLMLLAGHAAVALAEQITQESLMRSLQARDEILGIVAHDLRNPLNVIAAASSSLHMRLPDSLSRRPVERIMRAAQRAERLIRDLLDINAIESGQFSIQKQELDSTSTILSAVESQQGLAASSSVILATDLSPELPSIDADEERILEVLENLLGNALKFTPASGTVTVGASTRGGDVVIWVRDTGPGIPPEQLPHLFDRFWQGTRGDRRGAGLGLTICRAIVEAHGGRIWAESNLGEGTTVSFTVPTLRRLPRRHGTEVANILMVDDRQENLLSLQAILERPDYRLVTASGGEEALSLALRENFALALIDVAMPGMDGFEVAIHMKELARSRDITIIFITAFGDDPQEIHKAYSAGGADYLVKPLDAEIVRKKVAVFVDLSRRRNEGAQGSKASAEE